VPRIDFILEAWCRILSKEHWSSDFLFRPLSCLDVKSQFNKGWSQDRKDCIAGQAFVPSYRAYLMFAGAEQAYNLLNKLMR